MRTSKNRKNIFDTPFWTRGFSLVIFGPSHSRYVPLKAELPLPSSCCKGEACLPRSLQLHFLISPAKLDFLISPAKLDFFISPATAGRLLKILTMLLYEGIQE